MSSSTATVTAVALESTHVSAKGVEIVSSGQRLLSRVKESSLAFHIPHSHEELYDQVVSRFRMLLRRRVITGINDSRLNLWLKNFVSPEEQYLAARVLDNLSYRSQAMVTSAIQHVNEALLNFKWVAGRAG